MEPTETTAKWKDEAHKERAMSILDVLGGLAQVPYKTIETIKEEIKSQPYEPSSNQN